MDNLEKFIRENRESLDKCENDPRSWEKIESKLSTRKRVTWISVAATVVILTGLAALFIISGDQNQRTLNSGLAPDVSETVNFYTTMINTLYDEAKPLLTVRPEVEKELDSDMARIDSICTDIRNDLKDNVDNQEVIEALIRNYRIKIKILEDMLLILKKSEDENSKKESHEI